MVAVLWEASRACPERLSSVFDLRASSLRVEHAANRTEAAEVRRRHAALVQVKSCADANLTGLEAHAKRFAPSIVERGLRFVFLMHLFNLWDLGLLAQDDILRCIAVVDAFEAVRTDATPS